MAWKVWGAEREEPKGVCSLVGEMALQDGASAATPRRGCVPAEALREPRWMGNLDRFAFLRIPAKVSPG